MIDWGAIDLGDFAWLRERTILLVRSGSHAYGTAREGSDLDLRGACVPPRRALLGFPHPFEQAELKEPDLVVFDVRKLLALAAECNPGSIEVLWAADEDVVVCPEEGRRLREHRTLFLSRRARERFAGYANSQFKRIKTHRRWLLSPPTAPPTRAEMDLPDRPALTADELGVIDAQVKRRLEAWRVDLEGVEPAVRIALERRIEQAFEELGLVDEERRYSHAARQIGVDENLLDLVARERAWRAKVAEWKQYEGWRATRNPARVALEERFGYDTKHAMHLVRLLRMCAEILERGEVLVKRPDADELLRIRDGAWSFDELLSWSDAQQQTLDRLAKTTHLPAAPDREAIDRLCVEVVDSFLKRCG